MKFLVVLEFDEQEFDPEKLTKELVERVTKERLGGRGVKITVLGPDEFPSEY